MRFKLGEVLIHKETSQIFVVSDYYGREYVLTDKNNATRQFVHMQLVEDMCQVLKLGNLLYKGVES